MADEDIQALAICAKKMGGDYGEARECENGDHKEHSTVCLSNLSANSVLDIDWAVYSLCSILEIVLVFADPVRASVHLHRPLDSLLLNPLECTVGLSN